MFFRTDSTGSTSFFLHGGLLVILYGGHSLPMECFHLTYDLSGFKSRIRHLLTVGSFKTDTEMYPVIFFCVSFLVTPCLVVAVQLCME